MSQDIINNYKNYDFTKNQAWIDYYKSLYPTPSLEILEKKKRVWYKKNIDNNFDPNFVENNSNNNSSKKTTVDYKNSKLFMTEGYLKLFYIIMAFFALPFNSYITFHLLLGVIICLLGVIRQIGMVQFNKDYLLKFIGNDFGILLFYILVLFLLRKPYILYNIPLIIHFLIGVSNFNNLIDIKIFKKIKKLQDIFTLILQNKNIFIYARCYIEMILLFYTLLLIFFGKVSIFAIFLFYNYTKFRYLMNNYFNYVITSNKNYLNNILNNSKLPEKVKQISVKAVNLFFKLY